MGAFLWDDPHHDQWSEITRIIVDQMNRWIHSVQGFIGSLDLPWSEWSRISDADPDHPKETHPIIKHVQVNVNLHKKRKKKVENDLTLQLHVRLWLYTIL